MNDLSDRTYCAIVAAAVLAVPIEECGADTRSRRPFPMNVTGYFLRVHRGRKACSDKSPA